jgi:hypothetical protein
MAASDRAAAARDTGTRGQPRAGSALQRAKEASHGLGFVGAGSNPPGASSGPCDGSDRPRRTLPSLPSLLYRAATTLAGARTAAEVLEAREMATLAFDASKRTARLMRAKGAHEELVQVAYRMQADALEIEAAAKRRLADEYDAAQARGEVARHGGTRGNQHAKVPDRNDATTADLGLTRKQVHEARQVRDAEAAEPGLVRRALSITPSTGRGAWSSARHTQVHMAPSTHWPLSSAETWLVARRERRQVRRVSHHPHDRDGAGTSLVTGHHISGCPRMPLRGWRASGQSWLRRSARSASGRRRTLRLL